MKKHFLLVLILTLFTNITKGQNISVMTYNIRYDNPNDGENAWSNRKEYLCAQLTFYEPDILGVQEALPNQVDDIQTKLSTYLHIGVGRDGLNKGESSNVFYKKDRFTVIQENTFWLSETPDTISKGWDAALNRICTYALFKDQRTQRTFWVFNTHLDHKGVLARTNSITLILSKIKLLNTQNYPVLFMGDFNSEPSEDRIISLKSKMIEASSIAEEKAFGPTGTFNGFKHNEAVTKQIDYIFLSKNNTFQVKKYAVLSDSINLKYPSDHLPVYVVLDFN